MISRYGTTEAAQFLLGVGTDAAGRKVQDYFSFTQERWEECHNHIQWAFPSDIPSDFNPEAPLVDFESEEWKQLAHEDSIATGVVWMLINYYMASIGVAINVEDKFVQVSGHWNDIWRNYDHNYRRITRILHFLSHSGLAPDGMDAVSMGDRFIAFALMKRAERPDCIDDTTLAFWHAASRGNLHTFLKS